MLCISHASSKVLPGVVKFTDKFSIKVVFSNILRWLLLKLPRNNQSFLIQLQVAEHHCISHRIFSNFSCVLLLPSSLSQSSSVLIFAGMKWKCYLIFVYGSTTFVCYSKTFRQPCFFHLLLPISFSKKINFCSVLWRPVSLFLSVLEDYGS